MADVYRVERTEHPNISTVFAGRGRSFKVLSFIENNSPTTVILEYDIGAGCWISRKTLNAVVNPEAAVVGFLLGHIEQSPFDDLRKRLGRYEKANWALHNELLRAKRSATEGARKKRGTRGGRNS